MSPPEQKFERNRLLRALDADDYRWIAPQLEAVTMKSGDVLAEENQPFTHVYFMGTGVASVTNQVSGGTVEVGTVGNEGLAGLSVYLGGGGGIPSRTFVQVPGEGKRMPAAAFAAGAGERPGLQRILKRYVQAYLIQVSQTAACNRAHSVEERCARWLLMTHDRVGGGHTFPLTHQFLAYMLGVRRAGVTVAAGILQKAGLIHYTRGSITISDRTGLEAASCECYGVVAEHVDRLTCPAH
ncbi:MAG: Crp/Fnr family transcriptional regulator [Gemmatimonadaceae bacterium]